MELNMLLFSLTDDEIVIGLSLVRELRKDKQHKEAQHLENTIWSMLIWME